MVVGVVAPDPGKGQLTGATGRGMDSAKPIQPCPVATFRIDIGCNTYYRSHLSGNPQGQDRNFAVCDLSPHAENFDGSRATVR